MRIMGVKGRPKRVGKGIYREVFRVGNIVLKVQSESHEDIPKLHRRAVEVDSHNREIRKKLDFLPRYYGTVLMEVERKGRTSPAIVSFHEYVGPLPGYSIGTLRSIFSLIAKASSLGYVLDIKPSNFGVKGGRVFYLDEYGVGKGPLPPDVLEDLSEFARSALKRIGVKKAR
ncbi:MAG: hypothetical protein DRN83_03175 [Hadesarchaea archaeon]|nr:MAG: hypothetical protein DRN83_03175 [Hadesarchaea archaeon]